MSTPPIQPDLPVLTLDAVTKVFDGGLLALDGFSLTLRAGDFLTLLGPSGCGKSTVLRLIAGLAQPSAGRIDWPGALGPDDLGMVFQDATLMPWATVARNVWLPLRLRGQGFVASRDRVEQALDMVGLGDFADAYPRALSGGMKMRAAIARALVTRPRLLLMDEPFAALDELTRHRLNRDLLALKAQTGCTILYVTHSVFESVFLSDRIAVMSPRPGCVAHELVVNGPPIRDEAFRTSADFAAQSRAVSDALAQAMGEGAAS